MYNQRPEYQNNFSRVDGYNQPNYNNSYGNGGNYGYRGRYFPPNPAIQRGRGNFGYQRGAYSLNYGEGYSMIRYQGTPFNRNINYYHDNNYASRFNQNPRPSSSIRLGNARDEQKVFSDDKFSNQSHFMSFSEESGQAQRDNLEDESNFEMEGNSEEGGDFEDEDYDDEQTYATGWNEHWNEDEYDGSDNEYIPEKVNACVPSQEVVEKFKYFPPSAEEMGNMFKGMVIFFFYKTKGVQERNPFVIINESFRRSDRFAPLQIEDGYNRAEKYIKYCTIRWNGMMMVRGVGYSGNLKEPRVVAGVELINNLAMTCYILKMKDSYYSKGAIKEIVERGTDESNTVRIIQEHDAPNIESAKYHIINFFKDDNDRELLFPFRKYTPSLKGWAKHNGYNCRYYSSNSLNVLCVSVSRTPQYWRDKILASGRMENERFQLVPPHGMGNKLLEGFDITSVIGRLRKMAFATGPSTLHEESTKYAYNDEGLNIAKALPPWSRRGNQPNRGGGRFRRTSNTPNRGGGRFRKTSKKMRRVEKAMEGGQTKAFEKAYRNLSKKQRKTFRKRFNE